MKKFTALAVSLLKFVLYLPVSILSLVVLLCMSRKMIAKLYSGMDLKEQESRIATISKYVRAGQSVLDVGSGSGRFGRAIQERLGITVTGVDVCEYSDPSIPVHIYDGVTLPFADKAFDVVFLAFVAHHIEDQGTALREARRVAKDKVIVFEDTFFFPWERLFICWNDFQTNVLQGFIKYFKGYLAGNPAHMPMPLNFRSPAGWKTFFESLNFRVVSSEVRTTWYKPLNKITFQLIEDAYPPFNRHLHTVPEPVRGALPVRRRRLLPFTP